MIAIYIIQQKLLCMPHDVILYIYKQDICTTYARKFIIRIRKRLSFVHGDDHTNVRVNGVVYATPRLA
jgi:hypothetical protein